MLFFVCCGLSGIVKQHKLYLTTVNVLQLSNIDRREEMILFYSCQRWDCAESEVLGKSHRKKKSQSNEASQTQALCPATALCALLHMLYASERFALVLISQGAHGL